MDTIGIGCSGILLGSNGLSHGGTITGGVTTPRVVTPLPFAPVPEPATFLLFGFALAGLFTFRKRLLPVA